MVIPLIIHLNMLSHLLTGSVCRESYLYLLGIQSIYDIYGCERMNILGVQKEIKKIVGSKRITTGYIDRVFYSRDLSVDLTELPSMVILPKTVEEVSRIVIVELLDKLL